MLAGRNRKNYMRRGFSESKETDLGDDTADG
jgi:hypothetical protein